MLRRIIIVLGYTIATFLVVGLTFGLVAYGQDYSYDFSTHKIVRSGNVILQTVPSSVKYTLSGKPVKKRASYRLDAGASYAFEIIKDGYHTWHKDLAVVAGRVTLVQYVVLVPNNPKTETQFTTAAVTSQSLSRDHRHEAFITSGASAAVYEYELGAARPTKIYTPAAATDTTPGETLASVMWSDDASQLLVFSKVADKTVVRIMSATGSNVINLTDSYNFDFSGLTFGSNSSSQLYWIAPDGLRRLDLDNRSQPISAVLATDVSQVVISGGYEFYVQTSSTGQSLWVLNGRGNKPQQVVAALPTSASFGLAYVNYRGTDALAVVPAATGAGTLYTDIFSDTPVAQTVAHSVTAASFSPDGHILMFSGPNSVTTYDLDQSTVFNSVVDYTFTTGTMVTAPTWYDNFHLLLNENGRLVWREFDGQNQIDLGSAPASLSAASSSDARSLYTWVTKADGQMQLVNQLIKL